MKKALLRIKASMLYFIFFFFCFLLVSAITHPDNFQFRNGEAPTEGQRLIDVFVLFLLVVVSGYGAFKAAQRDWRLRKKCTKVEKNDSNSWSRQ